MYVKSKLTSKIYFNDVEVIQDDRLQEWLDYHAYILGNEVVAEVDFVGNELNEYSYNLLLSELTETCIYLTNRSLISSVNKEGDEVYLKGQAERYKEKYRVAKQFIFDGTILNQNWYNAIVSELSTTNDLMGMSITVSQFMGLIVQYFDVGELRNKKFESAIEIFRCKTKDLLLTNRFDRARLCLDLAKSIPLQMDENDLDNFLIDFNAL
jgi:hypothetical protein